MLPSQYIHIFIYLLTGTLFEKYLPTCLYFLVPTIQLLSSCTIPLYCSYQSGLWPPCNSVQQVLISPCISWSSLLITHSFLKSSSFFFFFFCFSGIFYFSSNHSGHSSFVTYSLGLYLLTLGHSWGRGFVLSKAPNYYSYGLKICVFSPEVS